MSMVRCCSGGYYGDGHICLRNPRPTGAPQRLLYEWQPADPMPGEWYEHSKGGTYRVVARASIEATLEPCIVYVANEDGNDGQVWVRPLSNFIERFTPFDAAAARLAAPLAPRQLDDGLLQEHSWIEGEDEPEDDTMTLPDRDTGEGQSGETCRCGHSQNQHKGSYGFGGCTACQCEHFGYSIPNAARESGEGEVPRLPEYDLVTRLLLCANALAVHGISTTAIDEAITIIERSHVRAAPSAVEDEQLLERLERFARLYDDTPHIYMTFREAAAALRAGAERERNLKGALRMVHAELVYGRHDCAYATVRQALGEHAGDSVKNELAVE